MSDLDEMLLVLKMIGLTPPGVADSQPPHLADGGPGGRAAA
jgi:hypothetical protein